MAKKRDARSHYHRSQGKKILIACEGEKTEPLYFKALGRCLDILPHVIHTVEGRGSGPMYVVERAVEERDQLRSQGKWNTHEDETWAVFDGDEHKKNDPARWLRCLDLARDENIQLAVCNPCIEYWFLLHFARMSAYITADQATTELKRHIPTYNKSREYVREIFLDKTTMAIENAKFVHSAAKLDGLEGYPNPCAHVAVLVERIVSLSTTFSSRQDKQSRLIREDSLGYGTEEILMLAGVF